MHFTADGLNFTSLLFAENQIITEDQSQEAVHKLSQTAGK
jgi:hypothetical protein